MSNSGCSSPQLQTSKGELKLADYKDKSVLIVNVASRCGLTPQYKDLQELADKYASTLQIVGQPCNQVGTAVSEGASGRAGGLQSEGVEEGWTSGGTVLRRSRIAAFSKDRLSTTDPRPPTYEDASADAQFKAQEPGTDDEILQFCQANYGVTFPIAKKVSSALE